MVNEMRFHQSRHSFIAIAEDGGIKLKTLIRSVVRSLARQSQAIRKYLMEDLLCR
jgi:hypothetical protein